MKYSIKQLFPAPGVHVFGCCIPDDELEQPDFWEIPVIGWAILRPYKQDPWDNPKIPVWTTDEVHLVIYDNDLQGGELLDQEDESINSCAKAVFTESLTEEDKTEMVAKCRRRKKDYKDKRDRHLLVISLYKKKIGTDSYTIQSYEALATITTEIVQETKFPRDYVRDAIQSFREVQRTKPVRKQA